MIDLTGLPRGSVVTLSGNLILVRRPGVPVVDMKINFDLPYAGQAAQICGVDEIAPFTEDQVRALGIRDQGNSQWLLKREIADA